MARPKVFVTRRIDQGSLDLLAQHTDVDVWEGWFPPPREELLARSAGRDALLTMVSDRVDGPLMDGAPGLVVVSNMATGLDNVDVAEATRRGVLVGRTPGVLDATCAEFTIALLLASARRVLEGDRFVRAGQWETWHPKQMVGRDLFDSTLGIIGLGNIGLEVAIRARALGMRVIYYQRHRRPDEEERLGLEYLPSMEAVLAAADFVSLHVPLTSETHHLIGAAELRAMQRHAVLVNTTRGAVVDQRALYEALREEVIAAAALDVTEVEPIPMDDPILTLPNVVIAPHIASASQGSRARMADLAARNLLAALNGEPMPACANPEVLERRGA